MPVPNNKGKLDALVPRVERSEGKLDLGGPLRGTEANAEGEGRAGEPAERSKLRVSAVGGEPVLHAAPPRGIDCVERHGADAWWRHRNKGGRNP